MLSIGSLDGGFGSEGWLCLGDLTTGAMQRMQKVQRMTVGVINKPELGNVTILYVILTNISCSTNWIEFIRLRTKPS